MTEVSDNTSDRLWLITFRAADGSRQALKMKASKRSDIFGHLNEQHITAIKIEEFANKEHDFKLPTHMSKVVKGCVVLSLVVLIIIAVRLLSGQNNVVKQPKSSTKQIVLTQTTPRTTKPSTTVTNNQIKSGPPRPVIGKTPTGQDYVAFTAQTNSIDGVIIERYQLPDGSWKRFVNLSTKENQIFDNEIDSMLATIASIPLTQELPPMPIVSGNLEDQFKKAIEHPIIIREDDNERVKQAKANVIALRLEMADLLREGYTVKQILDENQTLRQDNIQYRHELQCELNELCANGDHEGARQFFETMNAALADRGVLPLQMPGSIPSAKKESLKHR